MQFVDDSMTAQMFQQLWSQSIEKFSGLLTSGRNLSLPEIELGLGKEKVCLLLNNYNDNKIKT